MFQRTKELDQTFNEILKNRRTTRKFTSEPVSEDVINELLSSAVHAPFSGATGMQLREIRKLFVIKNPSPVLDRMKQLLVKRAKKMSFMMNIAVTISPVMRKKALVFSKILQNMAKNGLPSLEEAPVVIILAEKCSFPPSEKLALAHTQEVLWLKATTLGLGFQLLSLVELMSKDKEFAKLLGLKKGEFAFGGVVVGHPHMQPTALDRIPHQEITQYL